MERKETKQLRKNGQVYKVSPWVLTWDDENYYMIAYDSQSGIIKHYRVDKMLGIRVCTEKRQGAQLFKDFDMGLYSKKTFGMYGGRDEQVTLLCDNKMAGVIIDRFGRDVVMKERDQDTFEAAVKVAVSPLPHMGHELRRQYKDNVSGNGHRRIYRYGQKGDTDI